MTAYVIAKYLHVVGALGMFLALGLEWATLVQLRRAQTAEQVREWARVGAWLAVVETPVELTELSVPLYLGLAVVFWLAGFDIIYSLQDREFDRSQRLNSVPVRFGVARALQISTICHLCTIVFLVMVGLSAHMKIIYWIGLAAVVAVLMWEHRIVSPTDLSRINRAFFDLNAYVSIAFFFATVADIIVSSTV